MKQSSNKKRSQEAVEIIKRLEEDFGLSTVCQRTDCPNVKKCFSNKTATFLIMGNICTRDCSFCVAKTGTPGSLDQTEPGRITRAVENLGFKHVIITSVTRDDLSDGGIEHFCRVLKRLRMSESKVRVELLTPDFKLNKHAIKKLVQYKPEVFNHNLHTVSRLYSKVRPQADYERSLQVLQYVKELSDNVYTKSGIMLGLGETEEEVIQVMKDLREVECNIFTLGQYEQLDESNISVKKHVAAEQFKKYKQLGEEMGFKQVAIVPSVRSYCYLSELPGDLKVKHN